jgi:hypothetical protein
VSEKSLVGEIMMDCDFRKAIMDINHGVGDFRYRNGSWRARCAHYVQASAEICRVIQYVTYNYIVIS